MAKVISPLRRQVLCYSKRCSVRVQAAAVMIERISDSIDITTAARGSDKP